MVLYVFGLGGDVFLIPHDRLIFCHLETTNMQRQFRCLLKNSTVFFLFVVFCNWIFVFPSSMSIAASLVSEDTKTKFLNKMGQLTTSGAMLANVFQRKK